MKRCIAALALALVACPATALADPSELRTSTQDRSFSPLRAWGDVRAPDQRTAPALAPRLPASGTDVAAPDQQASPHGGSVAPAAAPSEFDWSDAGVGAAVATGLLGVSLAGGLTLRRRQYRRASAFAG